MFVIRRGEHTVLVHVFLVVRFATQSVCSRWHNSSHAIFRMSIPSAIPFRPSHVDPLAHVSPSIVPPPSFGVAVGEERSDRRRRCVVHKQVGAMSEWSRSKASRCHE